MSFFLVYLKLCQGISTRNLFGLIVMLPPVNHHLRLWIAAFLSVYITQQKNQNQAYWLQCVQYTLTLYQHAGHLLMLLLIIIKLVQYKNQTGTVWKKSFF